MNLWQQNRRRTSQANFLQKSPLKPRGIFLTPKGKEGKMTTPTYTRQEETEVRENWQIRKRKALQRELEKRQAKIFRRNPDRNLLALFQEYLQNERAA